MINYKFSTKQIKVFFYILSIIIIIGIIIPLIISFIQDDSKISFEDRAVAQTLIPKAMRIVSIYQSYDIQENGSVVIVTRTIFNIPLQKITFPATESGSNIIDYFPFK